MTDYVYVVEVSTEKVTDKSYVPDAQEIIGVAATVDIAYGLIYQDAEQRGLELGRRYEHTDGSITISATWRHDAGFAQYTLTRRKLWKE